MIMVHWISIWTNDDINKGDEVASVAEGQSVEKVAEHIAEGQSVAEDDAECQSVAEDVAEGRH